MSPFSDLEDINFGFLGVGVRTHEPASLSWPFPLWIRQLIVDLFGFITAARVVALSRDHPPVEAQLLALLGTAAGGGGRGEGGDGIFFNGGSSGCAVRSHGASDGVEEELCGDHSPPRRRRPWRRA